jgi:hypothetical protein
VGKMNLAWGNAFGRVWESEFWCARRAGANFEAVEPRPWRMMKVCLCSWAGATMMGSGYALFVRWDVGAVGLDILLAGAVVALRNEM